MSAQNTFNFGGFTLRPATHRDDLLAAKWTEADPFHRTMDPDFWLEQLPGRDSYLLEERGVPVFFFKIARQPENAVELHIQFRPDAGVKDDRTVRGLTEGMGWLEKTLLAGPTERIYFESSTPALIRFCTKRFGFTARAGRLWKTIERQRTPSVRSDVGPDQSAE